MDTNHTAIMEALRRPFPREDVEFRIGRVSARNRRANVLAYITARGIMSRLDEVFGLANWRDEYEVLQSGVKCRLSVKLGKDWIAKEDVAPFTNIEALKGAFSDSLKRAGVKFGIGRYLYDLPEYWVLLQEERPQDGLLPAHYYSSEGLTGWWVEPQLPEWALPDERARLPREQLELLDELNAAGLLTKPKHGQYLQALSDPKLTETAKALITEQLALISLWGGKVAPNAAIPAEMKKGSYRSIINSTASNLAKVREDLEQLAAIGTSGEAA
jgi:hypothetical protein